jgi:hypothetical protein
MTNKMHLGSICILFEDLGFKFRKPITYDDAIVKMTYHYHSNFLFDKIFADINKTWVLEVCFVPEEMHIDRWERRTSGLFIISDELSLDLHNPKSIDEATSFVTETIELAEVL